MKRALSLLLLSLFTVVAMAQHMKFMGIPIDGTINSFEQKLGAKGVKPDVEFDRPGIAHFIGTFFARPAQITVYYDPKTKIVYRAKVIIEANNETNVMKLYYEVVESMTDKYGEGEEDTSESFPVTRYYPESNGATIGEIDVYPDIFKIDYKTYYQFYIDYFDYTNEKIFKANKADDL